MRPFSIIVAADEAWGIGRDADLPWHLKGDMAWFKSVTTGEDPQGARNTVIMGRKTWDTIPARYQPLPDRDNVVVSRNRALDLGGKATLAHSLEEALDRPCAGERFVIGGGMLYAAALEHPQCDRLYITRVDGDHGCDTQMPQPSDAFELVEAQPPVTEPGGSYVITTWRRQ